MYHYLHCNQNILRITGEDDYSPEVYRGNGRWELYGDGDWLRDAGPLPDAEAKLQMEKVDACVPRKPES